MGGQLFRGKTLFGSSHHVPTLIFRVCVPLYIPLSVTTAPFPSSPHLFHHARPFHHVVLPRRHARRGALRIRNMMLVVRAEVSRPLSGPSLQYDVESSFPPSSSSRQRQHEPVQNPTKHRDIHPDDRLRVERQTVGRFRIAVDDFADCQPELSDRKGKLFIVQPVGGGRGLDPLVEVVEPLRHARPLPFCEPGRIMVDRRDGDVVPVVPKV